MCEGAHLLLYCDSFAVMSADFLRREETMKYGILAIQEPWAGNPYQHTTHNPVKNVFHLLYPPETGEQELPPRVCMFVNKDIASAS